MRTGRARPIYVSLWSSGEFAGLFGQSPRARHWNKNIDMTVVKEKYKKHLARTWGFAMRADCFLEGSLVCVRLCGGEGLRNLSPSLLTRVYGGLRSKISLCLASTAWPLGCVRASQFFY